MTDPNLLAVRAAVEQAKAIAEVFHTGVAKFYEVGNTTPVLVCSCRVKKPRPSNFDAGNQTEWATKRSVIIKVPLVFGVVDSVDYSSVETIESGWIVQVSTPDGDPTINNINFVVQSSLVSQFAAEREVSTMTERNVTPRIS